MAMSGSRWKFEIGQGCAHGQSRTWQQNMALSDQIVVNPTLKVAFCYALKTTPCFLKTAFLLFQP